MTGEDPDHRPSSTNGESAAEPDKQAHGLSMKANSRLKTLWLKTGLDLEATLKIAKGALAPTIAIAIFQADGVAETYGTLGYLIAVGAVLSFPIAPRAKFIQTVLFNTSLVCLAAAVNLLAIWSAVQARKHTTPPGTPLSDYNSSASVICAVWMFFEIYLIHSLVCARPQVKFGGVLASIFTVVSMVYGSAMPTMAAGISFALSLLRALLTGIAIATGVSLFVGPMTCRQITFKQMRAYLHCMRNVLKSQTGYMHGLETQNMFRASNEKHDSTSQSFDDDAEATAASLARSLNKAVGELRLLHSKIHADLTFAKREIAFGKMSASDISKTFQLMRLMFLPLIGMSSLFVIFEQVAKRYGFDTASKSGDEQDQSPHHDLENKMVKEWQRIVRRLNPSYDDMRNTMEDALKHILIVMEFETAKSLEIQYNSVDTTQPGQAGFVDTLEAKIDKFYESHETSLSRWWSESGSESLQTASLNGLGGDEEEAMRHQRQLLIILYMEYLLFSASRAFLDLVKFSDQHASKGTFRRNRLIVPGYKRLKKILWSITRPSDASGDGHEAMNDDEGAQQIYFGAAFHARKDPEHLSPRSRLQKAGNYLRTIPKAIRSPPSIYGFRVALAMISIGIPAFLRNTHEFFIAQRLFWALIMIAVAMSRTSGQAFFVYSLRLGATVLGMVAAYIVYYIVDGHSAGVIVMFFLALSGCFYIVVKYPRFLLFGQVAAVTTIIIVGYELQIAKVGRQVATSNGQRYYPLYLLAPYRLAITAAGIFVAFLFTVFPYPISETSALRNDMGAAIFVAANHYSVVHETVTTHTRFNSDFDDKGGKNSPIHYLAKARAKIFTKQMLLIERMKTEFAFTRWQIPIGGDFPRDTYGAMITCLERIVDYTALLGHAAYALGVKGDASQSRWREDLRQLFTSTETTSNRFTSILCLLSFSMLNAQPLPPNVRMPQAYELLHNLRVLDREILKYENVADPGYAAFAVIQIACRFIIADLHKLRGYVEELVGEFDFSIHSDRLLSSGDPV